MKTDEDRLIEQGFVLPRQLPDGRWIGLMQFIFTWGLVVDIDKDGHSRSRFCFEDMNEAVNALWLWSGEGDPPGPWVKEKGLGIERDNPKVLGGIPIITE